MVLEPFIKIFDYRCYGWRIKSACFCHTIFLALLVEIDLMPSKQDILLLLSLMKGKSTYIQKIIRKEDRSKMSSSTSRFLFDKDVPARIGDNSKRLVLFLANVAEYIRYICMQFRYERRIYVSSFSFVGKYC